MHLRTPPVCAHLLTFLSFKDILRRFGFMKNTRRDFYECGFKPQVQKPIKVSIQFLIITVGTKGK